MENLIDRKVPAWSLLLALALASICIVFAWTVAYENRALKEDIRVQEDRVPGFLYGTSILSEEATCLRSPWIRLKDRLIGSDSCSTSF